MKKAAIKEQDILKAYNHKQIDFDVEVLQISIAEISSQLDGSFFKGDAEFCALHISRMKNLVTLSTTLNENLDRYYFILYLQSAMAITQHAADFFSYKIVCDDFQEMIDNFQKSGGSILGCLSDIGEQSLPHGSKWELIFVKQLQSEIPEKPSQYTEILSHMKGLSDGGNFAPLRSKLFLGACAYLFTNRDANEFVTLAPKLVRYLFMSTKYEKLGNLHNQLMLLLLSKAQNKVPHAMRLLCELAENLTIAGGLNLVEKVLNGIVKPKKLDDKDRDYYSSFALGRILCLVLNQPRFSGFAIHPGQMDEFQSAAYHRALANYFTDYFNAMVEKNSENNDFGFVFELLRLYDFARKELPACGVYQRIINAKVTVAFQQRIAKLTLPGAIQVLDGGINVFRIADLFVNNLLDCFSYRELVRALIQLFDFALSQVVTPEDLLRSDPIYGALFATLSTAKRVNESEKQFHNRIACVIMLSYRYSLSENTWNHFAAILGEDNNERNFEIYVKKSPREICKSLLLVFRQHQRFFPNFEIATQHLVSSVYAWSEEAAGLKAVDPDLDAKIGTILSKLSPAGMMNVFQLPPHCFTALMKKFAIEIVERWCEILGFSHKQFTHAALKPLYQYLNEIGNYQLMMQIFDAARLESIETFEHALICFRADNPNSAAFIFSYMKRLAPQSPEKLAFIRNVDIILTQVPNSFWQNGEKVSLLSTLLFDLCISGLYSQRAVFLSLLELGADPFFHFNDTCAFLESIKLCASGNGSLEQICSYMHSQELQIDFPALHAICVDPLGMACRHEVPTEIIEVMLLIGFDVTKYNVSKQMMSGHEMIMSRVKPLQTELAKSDGNKSRDMFGFFKFADEDDEPPELYCDPITYELMKNPVLCTLDKKTYDKSSIKPYVEQHRCTPSNRVNILAPGVAVDTVLFEINDLKTAIAEWASSRKPEKGSEANNNNP